jgi:hypothetical protein
MSQYRVTPGLFSHKWRAAALFVALVSVFTLASCINLAGGDGGPTITLILPGNGESRTAYPNPGGLPSADVLAALHYQFDLTGPGNSKVSQSAQGISSVNIKVPAGGTWDLVVEARLNGQQLYASGSMTVDVSAGGNTRVSVPLKKEAGIGLHTVSGQIRSEYGAVSGARVRLMQGGSGFYMEGTTNSDGHYSIANVDEGSGNVIEVSCAGYETRSGSPFAVSGNLSGIDLATITNESVADFGPGAVVEPIIDVANDTDWNTACTTITNSNNKNYVVKVTGAIATINGKSAGSFGSASNIKVSLRGGGSLTLNSAGALVYLTGAAQVFILRNVSLIGLLPGNNTSPLVKIENGAMIMHDVGVIKDNSRGDDENGGGVEISGGSFTMYGGTIIGNMAENGGGVYISGGSFTKTGGTIYGDLGGVSNGNMATGQGNAVYYTVGAKYRNSTHGPGDGTLSTGNTGSGSGWQQ